jgi:hypothetical protein
MDAWAMHAEKYGIEYKYPLLDKDVLDFWFSLPVSFTYHKLDSRLLYREIMKGILTESIRNGRYKNEPLRIKYLQEKRRDAKEYLEKLFKDIPENEHLPYFRLKAFNKLFKSPVSENIIESWHHIEKLCFYLRTVQLVKTYIT